MRLLPALFAFSAATIAPAAYADDALDTPRIVISQQIEAFLNGDADKAYGFATPAIQAKFPDKALFFAMVQKNYGPVFRPGNFAFSRSRAFSDGALVVQEVLISGQDGHDWKALYQMMRQPDGSYRIGGVALVPDRFSKGI
jgi:Domain of unknown function (DUF4864)